MLLIIIIDMIIIIIIIIVIIKNMNKYPIISAWNSHT